MKKTDKDFEDFMKGMDTDESVLHHIVNLVVDGEPQEFSCKLAMSVRDFSKENDCKWVIDVIFNCQGLLSLKEQPYQKWQFKRTDEDPFFSHIVVVNEDKVQLHRLDLPLNVLNHPELTVLFVNDVIKF